MPKFIYISHEPLTRYLYKLFYMEAVRKAGFDTAYWDCSGIAWKGLRLPDTLDVPFMKSFNTLDELAAGIRDNAAPDTVFSVELKRDIANLPVFKLLSDYGCRTVKFNLFENCVLPTSRQEIWQSIRTGKIFRDMASRLHRIVRQKHTLRTYQTQGIKDYDLVFSSTEGCDVFINHPDYDDFLKNGGKQARSVSDRRKTIVYLDNYFPFHPDIVRNNPDMPAIDTDRHYQEMNELFDGVEHQFGGQVVIAAHPKSDYGKNVFQGREIVKYQTRELIARASLVLLHSSNAIAYAIAYGVPFMFVCTSQYTLAKTEYYRMRRLASYFEAPIVTPSGIGRDLDKWREPSTDDIRRYLYQFLTKPGIEAMTNEQIIIPELKKIAYRQQT